VSLGLSCSAQQASDPVFGRDYPRRVSPDLKDPLVWQVNHCEPSEALTTQLVFQVPALDFVADPSSPRVSLQLDFLQDLALVDQVWKLQIDQE
jgi:hypothetical protein